MRTNRILAVLLPSLLLAAQASAAVSDEVFQTAEPSLSEPLSQMAVEAGALNKAYAQRLAPAEFREARPAIKVTPEMRGHGAPDAAARIQAAAKVAAGPPAAIGVLPQPVYTNALLNFEGNSAHGAAPSDVNGAVGATQYVQWVNGNAGLSIFDKTTGAALPGSPMSGNAPWAGFTGTPGADACRTSGQGDILAQYDKLAGRWVLSQFAWLNANTNTGPYYQCVAVSTTNDATGAYNRYVFTSQTAAGATVFNDYGKVGIWPDAYYFTYVLFTPLAIGNYLGPQVCGYDRAAMLAGGVATAKCKEFGTAFGPLLPSDVDGTTPPPAGSPNFLMGFDFNGAGAGNLLQLWKYSFTTDVLSARTDIPVTPFIIGCPLGSGACVAQPAAGEALDSLADRPMYRLPYRNYGSREVLVLNHSVQQPGAATNGPLGVRWYELRNPNAAVSVYQQGTYAPDTNSRWMGSVAMDKKGNVALGYSVSGSAVFTSVRYTGRLRSEPSGFLETEASIIAGTGSQTGTFNRWGDYSSMSIDPTDDCTFWYTQQYIATTGSFNWKTRIASFKFKNCTP